MRDGLKQYLIKDIHELHDDHFKISMMSLRINETPVDISQVSPIFLCGPDGTWHQQNANLKTAVEMEIDGIVVPVVAKKELLAYKAILGRSTDLDDIQQMGQHE